MLILFWAVSSDHYYYNNNNKLEFSLHKFTHQIHHWIQNFTFSVLPKPNIFDISIYNLDNWKKVYSVVMGQALEKCAWAEHNRHLAFTFYAFYANIRAQAWNLKFKP